MSTLCCHFVVFYTKYFFLCAIVFLSQYNVQKVAEEQLKTRSFYNKYFFLYHCTSSFTSFFSPYVIKIIGFDSGLMAANCIPFRMAQNAMCHDLAKLQVIQSCDLLTLLSPDWGLITLLHKYKQSCWKQYSLISRGKCSSLSAPLTLITWSRQEYCIPTKRDSSFSENCVGRHWNGAVYPDWSVFEYHFKLKYTATEMLLLAKTVWIKLQDCFNKCF